MTQKLHNLGGYPRETRCGDIIACRSHGFSPISWIIRKRSSSQVNHVADCIGGDLMVEALSSVVLTDVQRLRKEWWIHLRPDFPVTSKQMQDFRTWQLDQVGKPYDWKGVFGFGPWNSFDRSTQNPNKWFCSEKSSAGYNINFNRDLVRAPDGYTFPSDILKSPLLKVVGYQWPKQLMGWLES